MIIIPIEFIYSSFSHASPYGAEEINKTTLNFTGETLIDAQTEVNRFFSDWKETGFYAPSGAGDAGSAKYGLLIPYHHLKSVFVHPPQG